MNVIDCFYNALNIYLYATPSKRYQAWLSYISPYPDLMDFCMVDYMEEGINPSTVGIKKVFHHKADIKVMTEAYNHLKDVLANQASCVQKLFSHEALDIDIIMYHGLGNGAGTATMFNERPTLLFGIEKIAELKWQSKARITALFIHEYAHLLHAYMRDDRIDKTYDNHQDNVYYKLYIEGVATYAESLCYSRAITQPIWFKNCLDAETELKHLFTDTIKKDADVRPFFGDWQPPLGIAESAYFMGMRIIEAMRKTMDLETIMTLPFEKVKPYIDTYFEV